MSDNHIPCFYARITRQEHWFAARIQYYCIWVMCMPVKKRRVVINNYKKWHDEISQILNSSNAETAGMSEEERKAEEKRDREEIIELIKQANSRRKQKLMIPRYTHRLLFEMLCRELLKYAKEDPTDLTIESDVRHGMIRMEFGQLILDEQHPISHRRVWKWLMSHADDIWATPIHRYGDQALQYIFTFNFQKEIRLK